MYIFYFILLYICRAISTQTNVKSVPRENKTSKIKVFFLINRKFKVTITNQIHKNKVL